MFGFFRKKTQIEQLIAKDGIEYVTDRFAEIISRKLPTNEIAYQFILEELDGASRGNTTSMDFAQSSGIPPEKYKGALSNSNPDVDGPGGPQQLLLAMSLELVKNRDLMAQFRCKIDEKIMKKFGLGKFRTNIVGSSPATNGEPEVWIDKLRSWADEIGVQDLKWEVQPRNRDGGFWTGFPRDAKRIRELEGLNIQSLGLTYLPKEIGNLTRLRKLWARENKLTKIPNEIGNLVLLEEIDFEGNQITAIPDSIGKLKHLRDLDLRSNQLNYVPVSVQNLGMLEKFDLRDQPINLGHIQTPLTDDQVRAICSLGDVVRW